MQAVLVQKSTAKCMKVQVFRQEFHPFTVEEFFNYALGKGFRKYPPTQKNYRLIKKLISYFGTVDHNDFFFSGRYSDFSLSMGVI